MSDVVVIGAGGHAKVVISTLRAAGHSAVVVLDDDASQRGKEILGGPVRGPGKAAGDVGCEWGVIAIGKNAIRKEIARSLSLRWLVLVHPAACIDPDAKLGAGTVVFAGAIIQPGTVLGEHVI